MLTRNTDFKEDGCIVKHNLQDAIESALENEKEEVFIIGGGQIYKEALEEDLIDRMYVTHVHQTFDADTFFPQIDSKKWKKISELIVNPDDKNPYKHSFVVYEKMN